METSVRHLRPLPLLFLLRPAHSSHRRLYDGAVPRRQYLMMSGLFPADDYSVFWFKQMFVDVPVSMAKQNHHCMSVKNKLSL